MCRLLLAAILVIVSVKAYAQNGAPPDPKDIIKKCRATLNATKPLPVLRTWQESSLTTMTTSQGTKEEAREFRTQIFAKFPGKYLERVVENGIMQQRKGTDGKVYWLEDAAHGARLMDDKEIAALKVNIGKVGTPAGADVLPPLQENQPGGLRFAGTARVGSADCYVIEARTDTQPPGTCQLSVDSKEYLPRRIVLTITEARVTTTHDDWRDDGRSFKTAHKTTLVGVGPVGLTMTVVCESMKRNAPLEDAVFTPPADLKPAPVAGEAPTPGAKAGK